MNFYSDLTTLELTRKPPGAFIDGWRDLVSPLTSSGVPSNVAARTQNFTINGFTQHQFRFEVSQLLYVSPFHVDHDIKVGGMALIHIHWMTDGTSTNRVRWEFQIARARGHNQESFTRVSPDRFVEENASGIPFRHMVSEVSESDALILTEPDEVFLVNIRRVEALSGPRNNDNVFGLMVDFHYETDRHATPNRSPNFYT